MSFSNRLTELYEIMQQSQGSLSFVGTEEFKKYLTDMTAKDFVESIFVYGYEIRDESPGEYNTYVLQFLDVINEIYQEHFKNEVEADNKLKVILNIGLINMYLYFCKRSGLGQTVNIIDDGIIKNVNQSVDFLKRATILANQTIDISTGIYTYHVIRAFDYIFSVFDNYRVDNNNIPIDLDSFYVFSDQLAEDSTLWLELVSQIKNKYGLKPGAINPDSRALSELALENASSAFREMNPSEE